MTLLSANQNAYIFRANDKKLYLFKTFTINKTQKPMNFFSNVNLGF